jgi:hypothetical protein
MEIRGVGGCRRENGSKARRREQEEKEQEKYGNDGKKAERNE